MTTLGLRYSALVLALGSALVAGDAGALAAEGQGAEPAGLSQATARPHVVVIGTGGTIAGTASSRVDFQAYQTGTLPVKQLVQSLQPEVGRLADTSTVDFGKHGSSDYTIADYHALSRLVDERLKRADAVVISTGTQTMEELAYWLDLTVRSPKPVVVTGAMRPWNVIGSDGPANLYNAVALAASGRTRCFGSVVMLNDEIHAARDATKTSTTRLDTFQSPEHGRLGAIEGKHIRLLRAPARVVDCGDLTRWRTPFDLAAVSPDRLPRVDLVYTYADAGAETVTALVDAGVKGLVLAGTPSPRQMSAALPALDSGVLIAAANRNTSGGVYDVPPGVIAAEDLLPQKARLLLLLALARTDDPNQVRSWFQAYGVRQFQPA